MATYVLIHGAGSTSWYWHLVTPELAARGHDVVAVDLPADDDSAGLEEYTDVVVDAIGDRRDLILVAQSMGGLTAPLVADRVPVDLIVLVAGMVPTPGESGGDWWVNTRHAEAREAAGGGDDPVELFLHDVPAAVQAESVAHLKDQSGTPFEKPWPLAAWPDVPTRFLLCRDDRFFPAEFQRRVVRERLGIEADEIPGGHVPALSRPAELVDRLERYRAEVEREATLGR
jgi:pimeloyl-ACP methyl ester carboxylesterase